MNKDFSDYLAIKHKKEQGCSGKVFREFIDWYADFYKCPDCEYKFEPIPNDN